MSKAISSSPHAKGQNVFMPIMGATVDSFVDSLLSAVRFSCHSAVFLGTARKMRRKLYMEISPAMGNIFPCTCPSKRSTASIIALSTWNVVTSPRFMTKHSLCHCSRVEKALTALTYGLLSTASVTLSICIYLGKSCVVCCP